MNPSKFAAFERLKKSVAPQEDPLLEDIRSICRQMDAAYIRFEMEQDEDLLEAAIYELEALKARYRYLIKRAKKNKLESTGISAFSSMLPKNSDSDIV